MLASFSNAAITVVVIAGLAGLAWFALRIDPHWVSKDGRRFTCKVQQIRQGGRIEGRWRDARCAVEGDRLRVMIRGLGVRPDPFANYRVIGTSADPPPRKAVFVIRDTTAKGANDGLFSLRLPANSRAIEQLESLVEHE
jgi:hypothetical protein